MAASALRHARLSKLRLFRVTPLPTRVHFGFRRPLHLSPPKCQNNDDIAAVGSLALDFGLDPLAVDEPVLSPSERIVLDERPAEEVFQVAQIGVSNLEASTERRLSELYRQLLGPICSGSSATAAATTATVAGSSSTGSSQSSVLLDLCSSWTSHLPQELQPKQVIGHGMNAEELAANSALTSSFVQDLNCRSRLPLPNASISAVLCCNGIQYLTRPEWVMAEVRRVLLPGGLVVVSFTSGDHCGGYCMERRRATAGWLARRTGRAKMQLLVRILESAGLRVGGGGVATEAAMAEDANDDDSSEGTLFVVVARKVADATTTTAAAVMAAEGMAAGVARVPAAAAATKDYGTLNHPAAATATAASVSACDDSGRSSGGSSSSIMEGAGVEVIIPSTSAGGDVGPPSSTTAAAAVASKYIGPALQEMDHLCSSSSLDMVVMTPAALAVLERWRQSYSAMVEDARELGIPASAIPLLPPDASAAEIRTARDQLHSIIASFLSAGL